jgi:hypothetical protein
MGLGVIAAAVRYQKHRLAIDARVQSQVPSWLRGLHPQARLQPFL